MVHVDFGSLVGLAHISLVHILSLARHYLIHTEKSLSLSFTAKLLVSMYILLDARPIK